MLAIIITLKLLIWYDLLLLLLLMSLTVLVEWFLAMYMVATMLRGHLYFIWKASLSNRWD